jgi:phytoene dehydrogenase-like protein
MQSKATYDAIIIGGGHNGLTAAAYLAKARLKVLVLERRGVLGGAAASEAIFPGYTVNTGALDSGLFLPEVVADLRLEKHGLQFLHSPAVLHALQTDDPGLTLWRDPKRSTAEIARFSAKDAEAYPAYVAWISRMAGVLRAAFLRTPPSIPDLPPGEMLAWLPSALKVRRLGKKDMMALLRALPMPLADFLDEWFEHPAVKAAVGAAGVTGSMLGPRASGTVFMLLYQAMNAGQAGFRASSFVRGGMGALSAALAHAATAHKAELRTGAAVEHILLEEGKASGVLLASGERLEGRAILSSATPRHTFFDLAGASNLAVGFSRELRNVRYRGSTARLNLALDGLPAFRSLPPDTGAADALSGHLLLYPSLDYLEHAYDDAKYGAVSAQPVLDFVIPTLLDDSLAPPGKHVLSANIQYAPYHLSEASWETQGPALVELVLKALEEHAPGLRDLVLHQQLLTPLDLEREYGLSEGCIFHGQMALDQLWFMRPVPGPAPYHTPIPNLFLCGAGSHPGGGVTGAPGRNAARVVIHEIDK